MEDKYKESPKGGKVRIPPQRGQIKARIFKELAIKVKAIVSLGGLGKKTGAGSSGSTSAYTSEGHSDS